MSLLKLIDLDLLERTVNTIKGLIPAAASATPLASTPSGAPGTSTNYARADHTHPYDSLIILSYGNSTWSDFIDAYNANKIVYCKASSNSNPATGTQGRMAFMAYINNNPPTSVEFQYYRSVNSHTVTQQGDQTYIYKLDKNNGWSVTTRENYTRIVGGDGISATFSSGVLTLDQNILPAVTSSDDGKTITVESGVWTLSSFPTELPTVSSSDNGKVLRVTSGAWAAVELPSASGVSF